jgi:inner membrane protein
LVVLVTGLACVVSWRSSAQTRAWFALVGCLCVLMLFAFASLSARHRAAAELSHWFPSARTEDLVLSPLPANPLCWSLLAVQTEAERYVVRRGAVALWPSLLPAARCPTRQPAVISAPLEAVPIRGNDQVALDRQFVAPLAELRTLANDHCALAALLRFTRVPYWKREADGLVIAGDVRYDRSPALEFAELSLPRQPRPCPRFVPSWRPPRAALLDRD